MSALVFARWDNYLRHLRNQHGGETTAPIEYGALGEKATDDEPTAKRQKIQTKGREYIVKFKNDTVLCPHIKKITNKEIKYILTP